MAKLNMVEALNLALREEMERDKRVVVLGEDVGREGGVFRVTDGLQEKFGPDRVIGRINDRFQYRLELFDFHRTYAVSPVAPLLVM